MPMDAVAAGRLGGVERGVRAANHRRGVFVGQQFRSPEAERHVQLAGAAAETGGIHRLAQPLQKRRGFRHLALRQN